MTTTEIQSAGRRQAQRLAILGPCLLLIWVAQVIVSRQFLPGPTFKVGPVTTFTGLYLLSWVPFLLAVRHCREPLSQIGKQLIIVIALLLRLAALAGQPVLEDDYYRYVWDGQVLLHGHNPYDRAPSELTVEELVADPALRPAATRVHERINYPAVKTIYPPVAQLLFAGHAAIFGWQPGRFGLTVLVIELLVLCCILRLNRVAGLPFGNVLVYAWNPLLLTQILNGWHFDILCVLWLVLLTICVFRERYGAACGWLLLAVYTKITPVVLAVLLLGIVWHRGRRRLAWQLGVGFLAVLAATAGSLSLACRQPLSGLQTFAQSWQINDSVFALTEAAAELVVAQPAAGQAVRLLLLAAYACLVCFAWRRCDGPRSFCAAALALLAAMFLLAPVGNPWYLTWLLPFLLITPQPAVLVLLAATSLYYPVLEAVYRGADDRVYYGLLWLEYLPVYGFAVWSWLRLPRPAK